MDEVAEPTKLWFYGTPEGPRTRLFGGSRHVTSRGGLVYVGDRERYEIRVYDPAHGLVQVNRLDRPRRPVTDEVLEDYREFLSENIDDPDRLQRRLESMEGQPVADSIPWVSDVMVDAPGNILVREPGVSGQNSAVIGVFAPDGRWLGTVRLPPGLRPLEIGEDYVLGVLTDELDVPHLVRYGLERGAAPMERSGG